MLGFSSSNGRYANNAFLFVIVSGNYAKISFLLSLVPVQFSKILKTIPRVTKHGGHYNLSPQNIFRQNIWLMFFACHNIVFPDFSFKNQVASRRIKLLLPKKINTDLIENFLIVSLFSYSTTTKKCMFRKKPRFYFNFFSILIVVWNKKSSTHHPLHKSPVLLNSEKIKSRAFVSWSTVLVLNIEWPPNKLFK